MPLRLRGTVLGALNLFLIDPGGIDPAAEAVVQEAKGIISERMDIPMDAAFVLLRSYSRNHNQKRHDAARDVVTGVLAAGDLT